MRKAHTPFVHGRACVISPHARPRKSFMEGTLPLDTSVAQRIWRPPLKRCPPNSLDRKFRLLQSGRQDKEFSCVVSAASGSSKKFNERDAIASCSRPKILQSSLPK